MKDQKRGHLQGPARVMMKLVPKAKDPRAATALAVANAPRPCRL